MTTDISLVIRNLLSTSLISQLFIVIIWRLVIDREVLHSTFHVRNDILKREGILLFIKYVTKQLSLLLNTKKLK